MYHGNLTFYGPEWLLAHSLILFVIPVAVYSLVAFILALLVKRLVPSKYIVVKRVLTGVGVAIAVAAIVNLFILDVLVRPDLVPSWLGGIRQ